MPNDDRSYRGSYGVFDPSHMRTYPLKVRPNKVELDDYVDVAALRRAEFRPPTTPWFRSGLRGGGADQSAGLRELADYIVECHRAGRPVVALSGAHPIKNGQIPIVIDLIERGIVTLFSTNGAGSIHSFELALTGASSESVRDALPNGDFGMAFETGAYLNCTIEIGAELGIGMGEAMGRLYCDADFRRQVIDRTFERYQDTGEYIKPYDGFPYLDSCVFAAAYRAGVPCYCSSPGDSTIGMNVAGVELLGNSLRVNPSIDVNETTGIVLAAKRAGYKTAALLIGGGSPKNFLLQTEPQIQEVLCIQEDGHDYFIQFTDARPDTGGLSGATPNEATTWGKVDPDRLPDAVVCYLDSTVAVPILTHYALARHKPRKLKRLYDRREACLDLVRKEFAAHVRSWA